MDRSVSVAGVGWVFFTGEGKVLVPRKSKPQAQWLTELMLHSISMQLFLNSLANCKAKLNSIDRFDQ